MMIVKQVERKRKFMYVYIYFTDCLLERNDNRVRMKVF